jgi:hypothetical protein
MKTARRTIFDLETVATPGVEGFCRIRQKPVHPLISLLGARCLILIAARLCRAAAADPDAAHFKPEKARSDLRLMLMSEEERAALPLYVAAANAPNTS